MCSQISQSFTRNRREALQFPSYLEHYSELHILPRSRDAMRSGSVTGLMCPGHTSAPMPCPSRRDPVSLSSAALTPQSTHGVIPFSKQWSEVAASKLRLQLAEDFGRNFPTGAPASVLCRCRWFKVTLPGTLYTWNTDTCPPGQSVKSRVPIIQTQHATQ